MLKIAVVDDTKDIREQIVAKVDQILFPTEIEYKIQQFDNGEALLAIVDEEGIDVLLLDIDMPKMNGIQVAEQLRLHKQMPIIIYITSETYYMPEAFGVNVFSFIDKRMLAEQLPSTILRCMNYIQQNISISFKTNSGYIQLKKDEIIYFYYEGRKVNVLTIFDTYEINAETLNSIAQKLNDDGFLFLNRGTLANIRYIKSTRNKVAQLAGVKEGIPISQDKAKLVNEKIMMYLSTRR